MILSLTDHIRSFQILSSSLTLEDSHDNLINSKVLATDSSSVDLNFRRRRRLFGVDFTESLLSLEPTGGVDNPSPENPLFKLSMSVLSCCENLFATLSALLGVVLPEAGLDALRFSRVNILGNELNL